MEENTGAFIRFSFISYIVPPYTLADSKFAKLSILIWRNINMNIIFHNFTKVERKWQTLISLSFTVLWIQRLGHEGPYHDANIFLSHTGRWKVENTHQPAETCSIFCGYLIQKTGCKTCNRGKQEEENDYKGNWSML